MLALAKKIPSDLSGIIQKNPKEVAVFLRTAKGLSRDEWENLTKDVLKQTNTN